LTSVQRALCNLIGREAKECLLNGIRMQHSSGVHREELAKGSCSFTHTHCVVPCTLNRICPSHSMMSPSLGALGALREYLWVLRKQCSYERSQHNGRQGEDSAPRRSAALALRIDSAPQMGDLRIGAAFHKGPSILSSRWKRLAEHVDVGGADTVLGGQLCHRNASFPLRLQKLLTADSAHVE
jgi:hypothetical protein